MAAEITMSELLEAHPGAQRALFRHFHIGGCASCGFRPEETLSEVCARNGNLDPRAVLETVQSASEEDARMMVTAGELSRLAGEGGLEILDIRTREEFEAVRIPGARHFDQALLNEALSGWPKDRAMVIVDHTGSRALDAAAFFAGHGFRNVRGLRGGIDAWSVEVDPSVPRYTTE